MELKHRYKIFNAPDYKDGTNDSDGYYTICLEDIKEHPDIEIVGGPIKKAPFGIYLLIKILRFLNIPCGILKPFVKAETDDSPNLCILIIRFFNANDLNWLRAICIIQRCPR